MRWRSPARKASCSATVEAQKRDRPRSHPLLEEERRDQETAEHEEEVDAQRPVPRPPEGMQPDDGHDCEGADAIELRPVPETAQPRDRPTLRRGPQPTEGLGGTPPCSALPRGTMRPSGWWGSKLAVRPMTVRRKPF